MTATNRMIDVQIQVVPDPNGWFIRMTMAGHETDRWGPYRSKEDALLYAGYAGDIAKATAAQMENKDRD